MTKKKQKLKTSSVYYYIRDMDKAVEFYTNTLGLPLKVRFDNNWAEVDAGTITIGFIPPRVGKNRNKEEELFLLA